MESSAIVKWAEGDQDFKNSFKLLYDRYLELGYIKEKKSDNKYYYNAHSFLPKTEKAILVRNNTVISTLDIIKDTESGGLPMDEIYNDELDYLRSKDRQLCEVGSLACSHDANWKNTFMPLFRAVFWYALDDEVNDICIMVNPKHVAFYKSILGFEILGEEKFYSGVNAPAIALRMNLDHCEQAVRSAYHGFSAESSLYSYLYERELTATPHESTVIEPKPQTHTGKRHLASLVQKKEAIRAQGGACLAAGY